MRFEVADTEEDDVVKAFSAHRAEDALAGRVHEARLDQRAQGRASMAVSSSGWTVVRNQTN